MQSPSLDDRRDPARTGRWTWAAFIFWIQLAFVAVGLVYAGAIGDGRLALQVLLVFGTIGLSTVWRRQLRGHGTQPLEWVIWVVAIVLGLLVFVT